MYFPKYNPLYNMGKYNEKKTNYKEHELKEVSGITLFFEDRRQPFQPGEPLTTDYVLEPLSVWSLIGVDCEFRLLKKEVTLLLTSMVDEVVARDHMWRLTEEELPPMLHNTTPEKAFSVYYYI